MKTYSAKELSHLLSEYLDGTLEAREQADLEEYLAAHPEAQKELRDLRQVKHLLAAGKRLPPDPFFWSRLSAHMESDAEEEQNLLPFPRKYIPLASAMAILAFVAVGVTIVLQREPILEYLSRQSQAVKEAYESSILKGSVLPLFANIDNDKVLQYALFGTLALDDKSETALRVDEQSEQVHIEVGMTADRLPPSVTVRDLYQEVLPTTEQRKRIDAVLDEAKARIAKGAFYAENNALAVDPELAKLNRVVLSNIAAVLAPVQRKLLDRFLVKTNASYALAEEKIPSSPEPRHVPEVFREPGAQHEFVVMTEDSTIVTRLTLNIDSLIQSRMFEAPVVASELPARLQHLMKARHERTAVGSVRPPRTPMPPLRTSGEEDFFKVEIAPRIYSEMESMRVWVTPRLKKEKMFRFEFRMEGGGTRVESSDGFEFDVRDMDSLMRVLTEEQLKHKEQFRKADSLFRSRVKVYSPQKRVTVEDTTQQN